MKFQFCLALALNCLTFTFGLEVKEIKASLSKGGKSTEKEVLIKDAATLLKDWTIKDNDSLIIEATLEMPGLADSLQQVSLSVKGSKVSNIVYPVVASPLGGKAAKSADASKYTFVLSQKEISALDSKSVELPDDKYELVLIAGGHSGKAADALTITGALKKPLGSVSIQFGLKQQEASYPFGEVLQPQPEIIHVFRKPEKRPPIFISQVFAAAVVAVPWLYLLVTWFRIGANANNFPFSSVSTLLFLGSLISLLVVLCFAWYEIKLFETLYYLTIFSIGAAIFGKGTLNYLVKNFKL